MANTRDIRRRIRSVESTRQITRAMEMVSATKMRRAQDAVTASRAYADRARGLFAMVRAAGSEEGMPLLEERPVKKRAMVVMSSDRGLAGALNTNVTRRVLGEADTATSYIAVGRKAEQSLRSAGRELLASFTGLLDTPHYSEVAPIARIVIEEFEAGRIDQFSLAYPKFVSTLRNEPTIERLVPAETPQTERTAGPTAVTVFEPSPAAVLTDLLPRLIEIQLWQALLETKASEHSARMMAMRNASDNASDLLDELKFSYNQARQAAITTEIAEIAAAADL